MSAAQTRLNQADAPAGDSAANVGASVRSRIRCDIDFDRSGRQAGYLRAPQSRNTSGWGVVICARPIYPLDEDVAFEPVATIYRSCA